MNNVRDFCHCLPELKSSHMLKGFMLLATRASRAQRHSQKHEVQTFFNIGFWLKRECVTKDY